MQINDLNVVLKVAEFRSIKGAAESLDLLTATASAALMRVERSLGVKLFQRSTRQLKVSPEGERFIPKIEQAFLLLSQIEQSAKNDKGIIDGEIRLAAPSDLGRNFVIDWLDEFVDIHPDVSIRLHISDSVMDLYKASVDVGLRYGEPKDARIYGFKICDVPRVLCASPTYLEKFGTPEHPQDLAAHNGLIYQLHDIAYDVWEFEQDENQYKVKMKSNRTTNDAETGPSMVCCRKRDSGKIRIGYVNRPA